MSTPNAIEVPGSLLAAIQQRLARDDVDDILHSAEPLTNWDRHQLQLARKSWQDQLQKASGMIKAINARLAAVQDGPADAGRARLQPLLEQAEGPPHDFLLQLLALFGLQERGYRGHAAAHSAGGLLVLVGRSLSDVRVCVSVPRGSGFG